MKQTSSLDGIEMTRLYLRPSGVVDRPGASQLEAAPAEQGSPCQREPVPDPQSLKDGHVEATRGPGEQSGTFPKRCCNISETFHAQ